MTTPQPSARKSKRVNVAMTPQLYAHLRHLAGHDGAVAETIRQAIRFYLDHQADLAGSRRHFTRSFHERIDALEARLSSQDEYLLRLRREVLAYLMTAVYTIAWLARLLVLKSSHLEDPAALNVHQHWRQGIDLTRQHARLLFDDMQALIAQLFGEDGHG